jgi:hypothetical protein
MSWDAPGWKQAALEYQHARGNHPLIAEAPLEDLAQLRRLMSERRFARAGMGGNKPGRTRAIQPSG